MVDERTEKRSIGKLNSPYRPLQGNIWSRDLLLQTGTLGFQFSRRMKKRILKFINKKLDLVYQNIVFYFLKIYRDF